jgi:hypothetical protein
MSIGHLPFNRTTYRYGSARPWLILLLCIAASISLSFVSRLVSNIADVIVSPFDSEIMTRSVFEIPNSLAAVATNCRFQKTMSVTCKKKHDEKQPVLKDWQTAQ